MDVFLDDIIDGVVHQIQDNVAPRVEKLTQHASRQWKHRQEDLSSFADSLISNTRKRSRPGRPPRNTDITYISDRLLVSSQPALAAYPTFEDLGRDDGSRLSFSSFEQSHQRPVLATRHGDSRDLENVVDVSMSLSPANKGLQPSGFRSPMHTLSDLPENPDSRDSTDDVNASQRNNEHGNTSSSAHACDQSLGTDVGNAGGTQDGVVGRDDNRRLMGNDLIFLATTDNKAEMPVSNIESSQMGSAEVCEVNVPKPETKIEDYIAMAAEPKRPEREHDTSSCSQDLSFRSNPLNHSLNDRAENVSTQASGSIQPKETEHSQLLSTSGSNLEISCADGECTVSEASSTTGRLSASLTSSSSAKDALKLNHSDALCDLTSHDYEKRHGSKNPILSTRNSPGDLVTYLDNRHGKHHYLAFSFKNDPPDDRTLLLFRRQIVQLGWSSPCLDRSSVPCIPQLIEACYAIHAYLRLDPANVALIYCSNGKSRTGVVIACYLKFSGMVDKAADGFSYFLSKFGRYESSDSILGNFPPSLRRFFHQFDEVLSKGCFLNRKPLFLKAVALQGLPVEDEPCVDIWDSKQRHVFSSHPEMWHAKTNIESSRNASKWADEDGFYQVNAVLDGDFLLLCRFGGDFAEDTSEHDPTKILFRYTNTTGCICGGRPYELRLDEVDLTKRYKNHLEDDFLVTLLFQADWEFTSEATGNSPPSALLEHTKAVSEICGGRVWRYHQQEMLQVGWDIIAKKHSARPGLADVAMFCRIKGIHYDELDELSRHHVGLALQLSNFESGLANDILACLRSIAASEEQSGSTDVDPNSTDNVKGTQMMEETATEDIFHVLGHIDSQANHDVPSFATLDAYSNSHSDEMGPGSNAIAPEIETKGWMVPSVISPQTGQIMGSFLQSLIAENDKTNPDDEKGKKSICGPCVPYGLVSKPTLPQRRTTPLVNADDSTFNLGSGDVVPQRETYSCLLHTGVPSDGLVHLRTESQRWTNEGGTIFEVKADKDVGLHRNQDNAALNEVQTRNVSINQEAKKKQEQKWLDDQKAQAQRKHDASQKNHPSKTSHEQDSMDSNGVLGLPLKDDPNFQKYFKMLKIGMPKDQVAHAMKRDEKDPAILDLDPTKPFLAQCPNANNADDNDLSLKENPLYAKYFKMLRMGMPREQVLHAMKRDEKDPKILDLDPSQSLASQKNQAANGNVDTPLKDDPEYAKYFKMLAMKLPMGAVKNALLRDGKDPCIMDLDHERSVQSQKSSAKETGEDTGPVLKDDPEYAKYFKMLAMKLPIGAVKNALVRDGKDPGIMDLDPNKSIASQLGADREEHDTGIPLKDDAEFSKYFKMEKMGLPRDAIRNALIRDGKDPGIIDLDPTKSVAFQMKLKKSPEAPLPLKKKKVRRKKIYWNPIDPGKIRADSMWNIVRDYVAMDKLNYDQKEFEELFTESADPADRKMKTTPKKESKKLVQVIDPKRSMNGGIVLARLKTDYRRIAEYVDKMEHGKFDSTQLKALKEYLPNPDERRGLVAYMKAGEKSEEVQQRLYADLSETEKYMVTLMDVPEASSKLEALLFRCVFTNRFQDVTDAVKTLNAACDELRSSERLRKLMAMILTVVNQINTGGEGNAALGFTLDALLKLNEAKAFDKKTSVLHYVVKLVKKNDESLISFESDLSHVIPAENFLLDAVSGDVKAITEELKEVLEIVRNEAQRLEEAGELRKMTLSELVEQKTMVHHVGIVPQFNKIAHLTGRTSMERFTLNAKLACEQASESINNVQKKYALVLAYFGEDENMSTGDFFGILRRFMAEWKKAVEQVDKIEKAQAKEKKRAAAKEAKKKSQTGTNTRNGANKRGISTLAAQHANASRPEGPQDENGFIKALSAAANPPPGGIATLAAEAALKRNAKLSNESSKQRVPKSANHVEKISLPQASVLGCGIDSVAAQAALKKHSKGGVAYNGEKVFSSETSSSNIATKTNSFGGTPSKLVQKIIDASGDFPIPPSDKTIAMHPNSSGVAQFDSQGRMSPKETGNLASLSAYRKSKSRSQQNLSVQVGQNRHRSATGDHPTNLADRVTDTSTPWDTTEKSAVVQSRSGEKANADILSPILQTGMEARPRFGGLPDKENEADDSPHGSAMNYESLDSLFGRHRPQGCPIEVLNHNYEDSSVAMIAGDFERQAFGTSDSDDTWNDGGGISDFMGWANLAIRASDTESVRGFEHSQNLDYNHDFDDESTIASTFYDDDASILSGMVTPRQDDISYFDDYRDINDSNLPKERNRPETVSPAKVAASIFFSEMEAKSSQVDEFHLPLANQRIYRGIGGEEETQDGKLDNNIGIDAGLSFGADVGFDDGLGFGDRGGDDVSAPRSHIGRTNHQPLASPDSNSLSPNSKGDESDKNKASSAASKWFGWGRG